MVFDLCPAFLGLRRWVSYEQFILSGHLPWEAGLSAGVLPSALNFLLLCFPSPLHAKGYCNLSSRLWRQWLIPVLHLYCFCGGIYRACCVPSEPDPFSTAYIWLLHSLLIWLTCESLECLLVFMLGLDFYTFAKWHWLALLKLPHSLMFNGNGSSAPPLAHFLLGVSVAENQKDQTRGEEVNRWRIMTLREHLQRK